MKTIKFSHLYNKMPRDFQYSKLLDVIPVNLEDLSLDFVLYDTSYNEGGEEKQYALPESGKYLMLLLQAGSGRGQIWTTLRSRWGRGRDKMVYYKEHVGEIFDCEVIG